jgi:GTP-binding nuclear protein Ran
MMHKNTFKVILVGDEGVGKTSLIKRHITGQFFAQYIPTLGVDVNPVRFNTSNGPICFNVWDTPGKTAFRFRGLGDGYYVQADAAIVMFDRTNATSCKNIEYWIYQIDRVCPDIPIVVVGTKCDLSSSLSYLLINNFISSEKNKRNIRYETISSKSNYAYDKPFLWLAQVLLKSNEISFVSQSETQSQFETGHIAEIKQLQLEMPKLRLEDCKTQMMLDVNVTSVEPQFVEPQFVEPQFVEPQFVEPQSVEPQSVEPQSVEPQRRKWSNWNYVKPWKWF